jgi:pimeloyl-ACP methyl ester carboxylesterase
MVTDTPSTSTEPPPIAGVRRSFVEARGVRFHVTEAGPEDGRPVLALHGWPQHHWAYRDLLADPPPGLRIIAPDLPGYGWSGPAPHQWAKEDVASDMLALLDALGLDRVLLVGHDWGGFVGYLMVLREPQRFDGYLALNMSHPWGIRPRNVLPRVYRFAYQLPLAFLGVPVQRHTKYVDMVFKVGSRLDSATARVFADRFRTPVGASAGRDTYRTFLLREVPAMRRNPEARRATVPIRALYGTGDAAVPLALVEPASAKADDYTLETADASHFIIDERPDLVRAKLVALAAETAS